MSFSVPHLNIEHVGAILESLLVSRRRGCATRWSCTPASGCATPQVTGYLVIVLSVASLDRLIRAVEDWEQTSRAEHGRRDPISATRSTAAIAAMVRGARRSRASSSPTQQLVVRSWNHWLAAQTGRSAARRRRPAAVRAVSRRSSSAASTRHYRDALAGEVRVLSRALPQVPAADHAQLARRRADRDGAERRGSRRCATAIAIVGTITVIEDVTERVIAERELRNQIAASEQARAARRRRVAAEGRVPRDAVARDPHAAERRASAGRASCGPQPIGAIARPTPLEVIERNAASQMRLVEDLLDMARIISGKLRLEIDAGRRSARSRRPRSTSWRRRPRPSASRSTARVRAGSAAGERRRRSAAAGRLEPALERGQVHRRRAAR